MKLNEIVDPMWPAASLSKSGYKTVLGNAWTLINRAAKESNESLADRLDMLDGARDIIADLRAAISTDAVIRKVAEEEMQAARRFDIGSLRRYVDGRLKQHFTNAQIDTAPYNDEHFRANVLGQIVEVLDHFIKLIHTELALQKAAK